MKKLLAQTDQKIVEFAKKIYKPDATEDVDHSVAAKSANYALQHPEADIQHRYSDLGLHKPGDPPPIPIPRGTVFASHLTTVHKHVRAFEELLHWWLEDKTFPFGTHWVKQLLGVEVENGDALLMMRKSRATAKSSQHEENRLCNTNAYTELENSIIAHLSSIFIMLHDANNGMSLGVPKDHRGRRRSTSVGRSMTPKDSPSTSIRLEEDTKGESPRSTTLGEFAAFASEANVVSAASEASVEQPLGTSPSASPSTFLEAEPKKSESQTPSRSKLQSKVVSGNREILVNLGIAKAVCRPGSASAAQPSSRPSSGRPRTDPLVRTPRAPLIDRRQREAELQGSKTVMQEMKTVNDGGDGKALFEELRKKTHSIRPPSATVTAEKFRQTLRFRGGDKHPVVQGEVGGPPRVDNVALTPRRYTEKDIGKEGTAKVTSSGWALLSDVGQRVAVATETVSTSLNRPTHGGPKHRKTWASNNETPWIGPSPPQNPSL